jgi:hypothetical protein
MLLLLFMMLFFVMLAVLVVVLLFVMLVLMLTVLLLLLFLLLRQRSLLPRALSQLNCRFVTLCKSHQLQSTQRVPPREHAGVLSRREGGCSV